MTSTSPQIHRPQTFDEAARLLAELDSDGAVMGGATWILRAQLRREPMKPAYVTLAEVREARTVATSGEMTRIGAAVTHAQLGRTNSDSPSLGAIHDAARVSAHTALRNAITVAGNLRTPLPEVDIVPALLASDCTVQVVGTEGASSLPIADFVPTRTVRPSTEAIVALEVPAGAQRRAAYERFTLVQGGGYGVATLAVSADVDGSSLHDTRVAIGALEEIPRRAAAAEALLNEHGVATSPNDFAAVVADEFSSRDGLDAPGWYRVSVLATLFQRVMSRISAD